MLKKLNVLGILERTQKFASNNLENTGENQEVIKVAGLAIKNTQIEILREIVEKVYLKEGLTKRTVKLSQKLDELIVADQKRRLEAC